MICFFRGGMQITAYPLWIHENKEVRFHETKSYIYSFYKSLIKTPVLVNTSSGVFVWIFLVKSISYHSANELEERLSAQGF